MKYRSGYKYQLHEDYIVQTNIYPPRRIVDHGFIRLDHNGVLTIKAGYAWDGPSGPSIDTRNFMRGSLVHDALYQLMREGLLDLGWRETADQELRRVCLEDGMSAIRAWWVYKAVRFGGESSAVWREPNVLVAP